MKHRTTDVTSLFDSRWLITSSLTIEQVARSRPIIASLSQTPAGMFADACLTGECLRGVQAAASMRAVSL